MEKTPAAINQLDPVTEDQVQLAQRVAATHAHDAGDLRIILGALGIGPNWREEWRGPIQSAS